MKPNSRTFQSLALLVAGGIFFHWLLGNYSVAVAAFSTVWGILFPFILGFIIAFLLNLPIRFIETKLFRSRGGRLRRPVSLVAALVLVLGVIVLAVWLVVPELWNTVLQLTASMPAYIRRVETALRPYYEYIPAIEEWLGHLDVDWAGLIRQVTDVLSSGAGNFLSSTVAVATSILGGAFSLFIGIIFACYLLLDKEHLTAQLKGLLQAYVPEKKCEKIEEIGRLTSRTFAHFVSGQVLEAALLTAVYLLILFCGGFDYALLIAVVVGIFSLVPMIGAYIGCFVGVLLLCVSMGFWRAVVFVVIMVVVQQIEGNFIYPHVIGSSVGLPPVWMLVAATAGGSLAGIFGMMFFIPLFSVVYALVREAVRARLVAKGIPVPQAPEKPRRGRRLSPRGNPPPEREEKNDAAADNGDGKFPENSRENTKK